MPSCSLLIICSIFFYQNWFFLVFY